MSYDDDAKSFDVYRYILSLIGGMSGKLEVSLINRPYGVQFIFHTLQLPT